MAHYNIKIAKAPSLGYESGVEFHTNIQTLANGCESRNADWDICRHSFTLPFNGLKKDIFLAIKAVHLAVRGSNHTFLHKDWADFEATDEPFGTGDGATAVFQLKKTVDLGGGATYVRTITKPEAGVVVKADGVVVPGVTVNTATGAVTFDVHPDMGAALTWSGTFLVQVRFNADKLTCTIDDKTGTVFVTNSSADLIEVLQE